MLEKDVFNITKFTQAISHNRSYWELKWGRFQHPEKKYLWLIPAPPSMFPARGKWYDGESRLVGLVSFVFTLWGTQNKRNLPH